jgi:ribonuclease HI
VEWRWVRGHADHPKNEYANYLATTAAKSGISRGVTESAFEEWIAVEMDKGRFTDFFDLPPDHTFRPDPAVAGP